MNPDTRLSTVLDAHPDVLALIIGLNPHDFSRLNNSRMRRFMAPRIKLSRVAKMAGVSGADLLARISVLTGEDAVELIYEESLPMLPESPPAWMQGVQEEAVFWVDVTSLDDNGDDPLPPIITAWKKLKPGELFGIKHRWEPQPLYDVWVKLGLEYWACQVAPDLWHIFVYRPVANDMVGGNL